MRIDMRLSLRAALFLLSLCVPLWATPTASESILTGRDDVPPVLLPPVAAQASTGERWAWLSQSGAFDDDYVLHDVAGPADTTRTVVIIPQVHPSDTLPLSWTSLGALTTHVQFNIDAALTQMTRGLALSCVGTEGSALARIDTPWALSRWVWRKRDVHSGARTVQKVLKSERMSDSGAVARMVAVLQPAIDAHRFQLDGPGYAQARIEDKTAVFRFGLEDDALNLKAIGIARLREQKEQRLFDATPQGERTRPSQTARAAWETMWLDEIDAHDAAVIAPYKAARDALATMQMSLRKRGAHEAATDVGRFLALAGRVDDEAIHSAAITAITARLRTAPPAHNAPDSDAGPGAEKATLTLTKKERAALEAEVSALTAEYDAVVMTAREQLAVRRTVAQLPHRDGLCAIVMGLNHQAGLVAAVQNAAPDVGIIVLQPFGDDL